jgi:hypothetical protein
LIEKVSIKSTLTAMLVTILGTLLIVAPWMLRNQQIAYVSSTGKVTKAPLLASRGGAILLGRSQLNETINKDPMGAAYVFSPPYLQTQIFENLLGYNSKDLWEGGKYASLNRNVHFKNNKNE